MCTSTNKIINVIFLKYLLCINANIYVNQLDIKIKCRYIYKIHFCFIAIDVSGLHP